MYDEQIAPAPNYSPLYHKRGQHLSFRDGQHRAGTVLRAKPMFLVLRSKCGPGRDLVEQPPSAESR